MRSTLPALAIAFAAALLSSCGTVGSLKPVEGGTTAKKYHRVAIMDYTANVPSDEVHVAAVAKAGYPNRIATELRRIAPNVNITRHAESGPGVLVVSGNIDRCEDGSAALRLWIGMGAGSSHFEAVTRFTDGGTGRVIGTITHDKNSWPLGGAIASTQRVEDFMDSAAAKTAEEIAKLVQ